ncbi:HugZ family protein [Thioclava sp. SK-1]|uniref:HugZ family pyridoxamine 5'-phosphate oxidase n=1 Tax=Thioclava sp. SK-1 TaxID=1889770 RepID=UPI00114CF7CB|nr:pyridoxamine 5'-phosphate oxidase family protein [Thioclava sp. SK-1]
MTPLTATDDEARALAAQLIDRARFGSLGTLDPDTGHPQVTRIALGPGPQGGLWTLISGLATHAKALQADPRAGLLLGDVAPKGDPLFHPRLSLRVTAHWLDPMDAMAPSLRDRWLADHPKSKLYIDLPDFSFIELRPVDANLNGGFGRSWHLTDQDLPSVAP